MRIKLYCRCELPLSIHIYSTVTNPRNSHNNLQHTFKSKLFKAYAVKDLLNYPFSTRKLKNNNFKIISHLSSSFKFHRKITCKFQTKYSNMNIKANINSIIQQHQQNFQLKLYSILELQLSQKQHNNNQDKYNNK